VVGQQQLADAGRVRGVAPADGRGQPDRAGGRVDLRAVDDLAAVEDRVVRRLTEPVGQRLQHRAHANVVRARLVVGEGHPEELVAEQVAAARVLVGQTGAAQRSQRPVHGRLGAADHPGQLLQPDTLGIPGQLLEDGEHAVGTDEPALVEPGHVLGPECCRFHRHVVIVHRVPQVRPSCR
jgi:hypothetical protein